MSAQTIISNSVHSILDKVDEFYVCQGDKYLNKSDYNLGKGADMEKFIIVQNLDRILTSNSCLKIDKEILIQNLNSILIKWVDVEIIK